MNHDFPITKEEFHNWLSKQTPKHELGSPDSCTQCPLCEAVEVLTGGAQIFFHGPDRWNFVGSHEHAPMKPVPMWAYKFQVNAINFTDSKPLVDYDDDNDPGILVKEALDILCREN